MEDRSAFWMHALEVAVFAAIIFFLIVVKNLSVGEVLYDYGVPLMIYIVVFTAYPIYQAFRLATVSKK